ncbi:CU044_5270 family protein [Actinocorallia aurantiaca]|uniref:CU044_5270 family protein n=1 Tax=Actinocorallia aurantiaca TaxID=46204 RepID=A0ABP6GVI0_9ACTN
MNEMEELRAARPAHLDAPVDAATRARELNHAFAQPRQPRRKTSPLRNARPMWGLGLAGAATAAAVAIAGLPGGTPSPPVAPAAASPSAAVVLDARTVLLSAASQAEAQQEKTADWWTSETVQRHMSRVQGDPSYAVYEISKSKAWTPYAPGGEQGGSSQRLGFEFPTPEDEAAWRQAGSPSKVAVAAPKPAAVGAPGRASYEITREPGKESTESNRLVDGDKVFWLGENVTMQDLLSLPDDPKRLKAWLLRSYKGHDTESSSVPMTSDAWLYRVATGLIADMPVTPKVRGAAFRMLADLKTVQVVANVTDFDGRSGTAVTMKEKANGAVLLNRLLFDQATGRALQTDGVVVEPGGYQKDLPAGTIWNSVTITSSGWADERP